MTKLKPLLKVNIARLLLGVGLILLFAHFLRPLFLKSQVTGVRTAALVCRYCAVTPGAIYAAKYAGGKIVTPVRLLGVDGEQLRVEILENDLVTQSRTGSMAKQRISGKIVTIFRY